MTYRNYQDTLVEMNEYLKQKGIPVVYMRLFDLLFKLGSEVYLVEVKRIRDRKGHQGKYVQYFALFTRSHHILQMKVAEAFGWKRILILAIRKEKDRRDLVFEDLGFIDRRILDYNSERVPVSMHKKIVEAISLEEWLRTKATI
jgi:hypothetical protein